MERAHDGTRNENKVVCYNFSTDDDNNDDDQGGHDELTLKPAHLSPIDSTLIFSYFGGKSAPPSIPRPGVVTMS